MAATPWRRPRCAHRHSPPCKERECRRRRTQRRRSWFFRAIMAKYLRCVTASSPASRHISGTGNGRKGRERRVLVLGGRQKLSATIRHPATRVAWPSRLLQAVTIPRRRPRTRRALGVRRSRQRPSTAYHHFFSSRYQARWPLKCCASSSERAVFLLF